MKRIADKESAHKRLLEARQLLMDKGKFHSDIEFAKIIGHPQPDVSAAVNGEMRKVTAGLLSRIADRFPDIINRDYLLEGIGELEKKTRKGSPFYDVDFALGFDSFANEFSDPDDYIEIPQINPDLWCRATGDSMAPTIHDRSLVALKAIPTPTVDDIHNNKVYAVNYDEEGENVRTIKRIRHGSRPGILVLVPDNPEYEPRRIRIDQILHLYDILAVFRRLH